MTPGQRDTILDARQVERTLQRMASEILKFAAAKNTELILVGIQRRGVELAERLARLIESKAGKPVPRGAIDITLYRDDLEVIGPRPIVGETHVPHELNGRWVVIVDDVLYTGRTVRAAMEELSNFGRPGRIGLCVLIDRGGRELPIQADIVGKAVEARPGDRVDVFVKEVDGKDGVELARGAEK
ncbi:MAG: bifunctional pyr operon transcriptional regulator/uracil phosphoribosyltransferase PyrR [Gemmatimonadetes bacterium]|jgi:pyrimidine operon attenuation protein/uracil phosphoribosyltransferase|nr:bifunctional pyr operon transcriptional regulator/uracil phosphoribosyltransferase PyrR [Gemmatimonadota bacterium]